MAKDKSNSDKELSFPKIEEEILSFWKKNKIFEKSLTLRQAQGKPFIFYEGPPYANGMPGIHHVEVRTFKDLINRYKTMRGYYVERQAGWDTHGLPTEMAAEKKLGINSKREIEEKIGIEKFVETAREDVFHYKDEWEKMTERMGYWLDLANPYVTMDNYYIESLWAIVKKINERGLLYQEDKILPWCIRCGTALSSHELAQGYQKTKDNSIYVRFGDFLVWTTTPWTLLGNVALAVHPDIEYVTVKDKGERFILAKKLAEKLFPDAKILETVKGKNLAGKTYDPLFKVNFEDENKKNAFKIVTGDFVSTEDGTGIVHIAPAFGEDDMNVGKEHNLPILKTVNDEGKFGDFINDWPGMLIWDANPKIIANLKQRKLLWKEELYEHDYPFCWRCESPLMYFAKKSWWIKMSALRNKLISENQKVDWHPSYLKDGRFGEWLREVKDWAFSRERYWGMPLPIWRCESCDKIEVVGSVDELKKHGATSGNQYIMMRHGEADHLTKNYIADDLEKYNPSLTKRGQTRAENSAKSMDKKKIKPDIIITSPFNRTRETAEIVAENFGIKKEDIVIDPRIAELSTGFSGKNPDEYHAFFKEPIEKFTQQPPNGESLTSVKTRTYEFLQELEKKYKEKKILIVSHEDTLWMLWTTAMGKNNQESLEEKNKRGGGFITTSEFQELVWEPIPRDSKGSFDLHKPYIDSLEIKCKKCKGSSKRVPEVADVWFDSGAMPFASRHWPFEKEKPPYPAEYICEAIDQTRGWFYTLLAVAVLLGKRAPYKNVISCGLVLDKTGKKMSKSKGNVVVPRTLFDKYGADAVRWYFFTVNQPWDEKYFNEDDVKNARRSFVDMLLNSYNFYNTYTEKEITDKKIKYKHILDQWIIARINKIVLETGDLLDKYDMVRAARLIEDFIGNDLSRWYIRRSRERIKGEEKDIVSRALKEVFYKISLICAPFAPFIAEHMYRNVSGKEESVHLEKWPKAEKISKAEQKLLEDMNIVRDIVSNVLELRAKSGIKVRQPLQRLKCKDKRLKSFDEELLQLIKEEVNIKEIEFDESLDEALWLDTEISNELKEEGEIRELVRTIQNLRKKTGLHPSDSVVIKLEDLPLYHKYEEKIMQNTRSKKIEWSKKPGAEIIK
ncbi:class I tRNA ligase family protein [Patescibacteria group bacterium]